MMKTPVDQLKFDADGLIPAIVQDANNGEVLMMAWMNAEAVKRTVETGLTHFYSRSRQKLWQKGESSGHVQKVSEILFDCDADCLLVKTDQEVAACHTGHRSCFYRNLRGGTVAEKVFDETDVYEGREAMEILDRLFGIITDRKAKPTEGSYTSRLLSGGRVAVGEKVLEEAREMVEAMEEGPDRVIQEAADLIYHTWVLLAAADVTPQQVKEELAGRFGKSGLKEKKERKKT